MKARYVIVHHPGGKESMRTYNTLQELVRRTRVRFAQKTEHGWVARRNAKNASHRLHYMFVYGQLDRNRVTLEAISEA